MAGKTQRGQREEATATGARSGSGRLEVIATPIGNLGDLSSRARETLAAADTVLAEDTRRTGQLLATLGLRKPMLSLHAHNERERLEEVLARLAAGEVVALVSDAGTPLLSDPGFALVREAAAQGIAVRSIPGPTAIAAALSVAGIATDRFCFEGFLPARARERRQRLETLAREPRTLVFFEAPHRICEALKDLAEVFGATRRAAVARELTKLHEQVYRGELAGLAEQAQRDPLWQKGEITLVVAGASDAREGEAVLRSCEDSAEQSAEESLELAALLDKVLRAALVHLPAAKAAALAAAVTGARREQAYARAVALRGSREGGRLED